MKMTTFRHASMPKSALATAVAAMAFLAAADAGASTTLYSNSFDTYTNASSLTSAAGGSWSKDGNGTATITTAAGLAESGAGAALLTPASTTGGTWVYRPNTLISDPVGSNTPIVTSSASLRIASPASGTANRSVVLGLQTYDSAVNTIASTLLVWDGAGSYGFGTNHLVLQFDFGDGSQDFGYDFGAVTSAQLSSVGYFNVSIGLDYTTGDVSFGWSNSVLGHSFAIEDTHGSFDTGVSSDFSDADLYYTRGSTGGTLPRLLADNYSITTSPAAAVPEPETWALMLSGLAGVGMLARRRKPQ